jgi:biopolymer transport protein ExbD
MESRRKSAGQTIMADINITPFTDVVLVLLIIFMVATPLIFQNKVKINLPQSKSEKTDEKPLKMIVGISEQGDIYVENVKYDINADVEKLKSKILATVGNGDDSTLVINGDKNCRYDYVVRIIDIAKEAGIKKIMLGTESKK